MPEIGQTISHYRIVEKIGQGGMGEVYLADDTSLDRKVALKFLPDAFTSDPERMARFEREAKLLASLNHPNIAGIYGLEQADGNRFLVLEYVEGETLQSRLSKGALTLEDSLELCRQIAEGLEAAHEKGVIHRDLKPANVMITAEEKVKILDFGLAKAFSDDTQSIDSSQSPTLTEAMTQPGVILGTAAYMSPEQAKGKSVDKRADIWAFGCILFECLTGKRAFEGETVTETLAAILRGELDWSALRKDITQNVRFVLQRCLEKDRNRRFRDIADVQIEMEEVRDFDKITAPVKHAQLSFVWISITALLTIALGVLTFLQFRNQEAAEAKKYHLSVPPMPGDYGMAISPDGSRIAYVAPSSTSAGSLFVCEIGSVTPFQLQGSEGAAHPFWSPDGRSIAFFSEGWLKRVDLSGGPPRNICRTTREFGGTWNSNGTILFADQPNIYRVSDEAGDPIVVSRPDKSNMEGGHVFPYFLPDGRHYLYTAEFPIPLDNGIYLASLESKEKTRLLPGLSSAAYVEPGYLLYNRGGTLIAKPFDKNALKFTGEEFRIADNILIDENGEWAAFSASKTGVLIYRSAEDDPQKSQFVWLDRNGKELEAVGKPGKYDSDFDLSPDGKLIAFTDVDYATSRFDIALLDLITGVQTTIIDDPGLDYAPHWSPDGLQIAFASWRKPDCDIFVKKVDGRNEETMLIESPANERSAAWSKNGRYLLYTQETDTGSGIYALPLSGDGKPIEIVPPQEIALYPALSANDKWLAYQSMKSGTSEIYVISFPEPHLKRKISDSGGMSPRWREDGKELYYLALDGKIMAADISMGAKIDSGKPQELFISHVQLNDKVYSFSPNSDGTRFLWLKQLTDTASTPITIVLNWTSLLDQ